MKYLVLVFLYFMSFSSSHAETCLNNSEINKRKEFGVNINASKIQEYGSVLITVDLANVENLDMALAQFIFTRFKRGLDGLKFAEKGEFITASALPGKFLITKENVLRPNLGYMKAFDTAVQLGGKEYAAFSVMYYEKPDAPEKTKEFENYLKEEIAKSICKL